MERKSPGNNGDTNGRVLLAVLAHPDDESFGMGGTLALYAKRGVEVHLVCATHGEAGEMPENFLEGFDSIAERREHELRCASQELGLKGVHFLGYRDSGMAGSSDNHHPNSLASAPLEDVAKLVAGHIRKLKPQVVITFDPIGGYRHPDHIAIHKATVKGFEMAGNEEIGIDGFPAFTPQKLYFHTISRTFLRFAVRLLKFLGKDPSKWGKNRDIDLVALTEVDFPNHAIIDFSEVWERKNRAAICHASQGGIEMRKGLMYWVLKFSGHKENYMRAYPEPELSVIEKDLFSGVNL